MNIMVHKIGDIDVGPVCDTAWMHSDYSNPKDVLRCPL